MNVSSDPTVAGSLLFSDGVRGRDPGLAVTDYAALKAIVQAAVNVELFTIPLYMTSLYSLYGTHAIKGKEDFYVGRMWPGMGTSANPDQDFDRHEPRAKDNPKAFNAIFSVFIAEMLHLQLASNICNALKVQPSFTSPALQNGHYGWTCYGDDKTVIPHILDFKDTVAPYDSLKVKLDAVNFQQIQLFLAIEETEDKTEAILKPDPEVRRKYFPTVPFAGWTPESTETDLPLFGSIGHMYQCLWDYLSIRYSDDTSLWDRVFAPGALQQDVFNGNSGPWSGHMPEYPGMNTVIDSTNARLAQSQLLDMIDGITSQGEGKGIVAEIKARIGLPLRAVPKNYQPDAAALEADYPSYTTDGKPARHSADAKARVSYGADDHYEVFQKVAGMLDTGAILTWDTWHATGGKWTEAMLQTADYANNKYQEVLPPAADIAGALNNLKTDPNGSNYDLFSQAAAGAVAGITKVLNAYWQNPAGGFPYPSMVGSGDRTSICWAIFGKAPKLSLGAEPRQEGVLYHACQGLNLDAAQGDVSDPAHCAAVAVYHSCRGSNDCKAEGGCGFVQSVQGGASGCSTKLAYSFPGRRQKGDTAHPLGAENLCSGPTPPVTSYVSAPSDNKCATYGGCAVPISASQLFPAPPTAGTVMALNDFPAPDYTPQSMGDMPYSHGESVYDVAWEAYTRVLNNQGKTPPEKPKASDLRLAFPPST